MADEAFVQNGVKGVGSVPGVEVPTGVFAIAVEEEFAAAVEEAGEFRNNLCVKS